MLHRFDGSPQPALVGVVDRHEHREERLIRELGRGLPDGANVPAAQSIAAADPPVLVLGTVSRPAEALTEVGNDGGAGTFTREIVNTCVDRPEESAWSGLEQHARGVSNRRRDVPRPGWMRPPPEQEDSHRCHADTHDPARANSPGRAETRGQLDRLVARLPVISTSQYNSRACCRKMRMRASRVHPFHVRHPRVTAAGRWLFLAGLLFMVTGDGPASTIGISRWPTPLPFLAWPWLYLVLLVLGARVFVAGGGVKSWRLSAPPLHRRASRRSAGGVSPVHASRRRSTSMQRARLSHRARHRRRLLDLRAAHRGRASARGDLAGDRHRPAPAGRPRHPLATRRRAERRRVSGPQQRLASASCSSPGSSTCWRRCCSRGRWANRGSAWRPSTGSRGR